MNDPLIGHPVAISLGESGNSSPVPVTRLIIAGWTGRNRAEVQHHVDELVAIGIPAPSTTPLFYQVSAHLLTVSSSIQVVGQQTSGEAEAVIIAARDELWLTVGSDHTDRSLEKYGVAAAKQACPKPICNRAWRLAELESHWDDLILRSHVLSEGRRRLYQEGSLRGLLQLRDLISRAQTHLAPGAVMFCGTVPALGGIAPADEICVELYDPVRHRSLTHCYAVEALELIS